MEGIYSRAVVRCVSSLILAHISPQSCCVGRNSRDLERELSVCGNHYFLSNAGGALQFPNDDASSRPLSSPHIVTTYTCTTLPTSPSTIHKFEKSIPLPHS